ncbi:aldo/keto reductase [Bacillus sp. 03113]|uniref:aldo/keto reductase n=1 Tax=Bacillus sp. 03113 TaxID=2578211 RepID=UPI0011445A34|nr:aldo/keto reductase [Bacillus sp. 03113]
MVNSIEQTVKLHNGVLMPQLGLGVYKVEEGSQAVETVKTALQLGYRSIDTAAFYENEEGVGQGIRESGIPRDEIFVTTKLWNDDHGYESTLKAFDESMEKLGLDYLDLYLIHWPGKDKYLDTWRAFEKLYKDGRVRAIGVSNFKIHHLNTLLENSIEKPVVNQVELHPHFSQPELRAFCAEQDIKVEAWSPLARGLSLEVPIIKEIAQKHEKSPAQVVLRWHLQNDTIIIPKSVSPIRLAENANIFDFELSSEEMNLIHSVNVNERTGKDPDELLF